MYQNNAVCANGAMYRKDVRGFLPELMEKMYNDRVKFKRKMLEVKQEYENTKDKIGNEHRLKTGHYYYTDVTKAHAVRNESDVDRIHLVIDCYSNNALRTLIA